MIDSEDIISLEDVAFGYPTGGFELHIPALGIRPQERVAVIGPSGSGKTTLISLIAGLLTPRSGHVRVADLALSAASDTHRRSFRIANIGFVFQEFELLDYLSVRENILLPYRVSNALCLTRDVRDRAAELAESLHIADKLGRYPRKLSQGERQRVAICRALITQPALIIADEPTGSLDVETAADMLDLLFTVAEQHDATLLVVTHDRALLDRFDRTLGMRALTAGIHA